jgi:hypothetical protein
VKELYEVADSEGIEIVYGDFPMTVSLSMPGYVALDFSLLYDAIEERVHCAHEVGHCCTGAFYNRYAPHDLRSRYETKANKWAIKKLVPVDELEQAVKDGYTEVYQLAEYFRVTEDFMKMAICWYVHHNLSVDSYF